MATFANPSARKIIDPPSPASSLDTRKHLARSQGRRPSPTQSPPFAHAMFRENRGSNAMTAPIEPFVFPGDCQAGQELTSILVDGYACRDQTYFLVQVSATFGMWRAEVPWTGDVKEHNFSCPIERRFLQRKRPV